jgi:acylglycerol lipase
MEIETGRIKLRDNITLYYKYYNNDKDNLIVQTHGIGEHCDRHLYLNDLVSSKYNLFQYDVRGHGRSEGRRAFVKEFDYFMKDLHEILLWLVSEKQMNKFTLLGHSMGGHITAAYMQKYAVSEMYPEKVILTSPPVFVGGPLEIIAQKIGHSVFAKLATLPSIPVPGTVNLDDLSHDIKVGQDYKRDPLTRLKLHSKLLFSFVKSIKETWNRPLNIKCPVVITCGSKDNLVSFNACQKYCREIEKDIEFHSVEGAFHEIHNEIPQYREPFFDYLKTKLEITS